MTRRQMIEMIPSVDPVQWFADGKRVLSRGKVICPAALAEDDKVNEILSWEADLQTWHTPPFEGPTSRWPFIEYKLMQHARGVANMIENKQNEELTKKK